ncbi:MAG: hypothetical protein LBU62_02330, partial [Bacteroidales bacterium]|nr:hypothetical protein [Bacteroidales bacterium]
SNDCMPIGKFFMIVGFKISTKLHENRGISKRAATQHGNETKNHYLTFVNKRILLVFVPCQLIFIGDRQQSRGRQYLTSTYHECANR